MLDRIGALLITGYALWHAYKHARRPRWADHLHDLHDLQREQIANQREILTLQQQGPEILAAVIAAVDGGIGGKVGLGFGKPGYPGSAARY